MHTGLYKPTYMVGDFFFPQQNSVNDHSFYEKDDKNLKDLRIIKANK